MFQLCSISLAGLYCLRIIITTRIYDKKRKNTRDDRKHSIRIFDVKIYVRFYLKEVVVFKKNNYIKNTYVGYLERTNDVHEI